MRRVIVISSLLLTALLAAAPVAASGNTIHYTQTGRGADAVFSTFPFDTGPVPDVVYTDTFLSTSQSAVKEDGTVFSDKFLFIERYSYKFDNKGNFAFVSDTFGFAGGPDVTLSVAKNLTTASVTATVALTTCTPDKKGNITCADAGAATVSGSWTGLGDIVRQNGTSHVVSKGFTYNAHFRGTFRDATAAGQMNGTDFGPLLFADIFNSTSKEVFVTHGN